MTITAGQCRGARALLGWKQSDLKERSGVSKPSIAEFERGASTPYKRTLQMLVAAFEAAGIIFLEPQAGQHAGGVAYKEDFDFSSLNEQMSSSSGSKPSNALDASGYDWESEPSEDDEPLPPLEWTDGDKCAQIEHWRARPEAWAALAEVSRQCLLRAMGVERL